MRAYTSKFGKIINVFSYYNNQSDVYYNFVLVVALNYNP